LYGPSGLVSANWFATHPSGQATGLAPGNYIVAIKGGGITTGEYLLRASTQSSGASIQGRHIFYNGSAFDGNNTAANAADDGAIDPSKSALLPGQTATFANYIGYSRGINGIMIDIAGLAKTPEVSDFQFHDMSRTGSVPSVAPAPTSITVRPGAGAGGSDRVTLIWDTAGGAVFNTTWLRVTAGTSLGLAEPDVFYFGSAPGEGSGGAGATVDSSDEIGARNNGRGFGNLAPVDDTWDYNKDRQVDGTDQIFARNNSTGFTTRLELFAAPAAAPLAAAFATGDSHSGPPLAAALIGEANPWSAIDIGGEATRSQVREKHVAEDERIWADEEELGWPTASDATKLDRDTDEALQEEFDWLAWDGLRGDQA
jgi:hypothetical protein